MWTSREVTSQWFQKEFWACHRMASRHHHQYQHEEQHHQEKDYDHHDYRDSGKCDCS